MLARAPNLKTWCAWCAICKSGADLTLREKKREREFKRLEYLSQESIKMLLIVRVLLFYFNILIISKTLKKEDFKKILRTLSILLGCVIPS